MSDGKLFALVAGMTALIVALFVGIAHIHVLFPVHQTTELLPGQTVQIANSDYSDIEIHSQYPVAVREGFCYWPRVADIRFRCPAAPIEITDTRPALLLWAQANHIRLVAR